MIFVFQILVFNQYDEYYTLKPIRLLKEVQEGTNCTLIFSEGRSISQP